jgi:hypothetical protein
MEFYGVVVVEIDIFLSSAVVGDEWSASRHFTPREKAPGTHWIGGCVWMSRRRENS